MATIGQLLEYGKELLEKSGNEYAKYERRVLLEEATGMTYMQMLLNEQMVVPEEKEQLYRLFLEKRCNHYPLQYILGYAHFMDYTFYVDENVLIPRNDTEVLVETIHDILDKKTDTDNKDSLLDLCCGSGCIGISLKLYHEELFLTLSDVSKEALSVAQRNLEKYQVSAQVIQSDLFHNIEGQFSVIVSNPPYIESAVIETLMPEVKDYEPVLALDGGEDGLYFYRQIIELSGQYLKKGGWLFFEIGYNQGEPVKTLMEAAEFTQVVVKKDYAGMDRVVYGMK